MHSRFSTTILNWPSDKNELLFFGNEDIKVLVDWFRDMLVRGGCVVADVLNEWRSLKKLISNCFSDKPYSGVYCILLEKEPYQSKLGNILQLVQILLTLTISSENCGRVFMQRSKEDQNSNSKQPFRMSALGSDPH
eukprot:m.250738 g.250738  ORF g.250738 m.250738 type:complete len:136 (+) comp40325_c0_seq10:319-726(+)